MKRMEQPGWSLSMTNNGQKPDKLHPFQRPRWRLMKTVKNSKSQATLESRADHLTK